MNHLLLNYDENQNARAYHRLSTFMGHDTNVDTGLQISQFDLKKNLYQHHDLARQSVVVIHFRPRVTRLHVVNPGSPIQYCSYRVIAVIPSDKSMLLEDGGERMKVIDAPIENM